MENAEEVGKDPKRVEAGKKAAATRQGKPYEGGDHGMKDTEEFNEDGKDPKRVEAGKKAAATRRSARSSSSHEGHQDKNNEEAREDGKDPKRVEAGKKAAATCYGKSYDGDDHEMKDDEEDDGKDPQKVEAGKKGAAARHGKSSERADHDKKNDEGKDPKRVEKIILRRISKPPKQTIYEVVKAQEPTNEEEAMRGCGEHVDLHLVEIEGLTQKFGVHSVEVQNKWNSIMNTYPNDLKMWQRHLTYYRSKGSSFSAEYY